MKVLIWVLTIIVGTVLNAFIGAVLGIRAGAVLLYIIEAFIAKKLCEKWDEHKERTITQNGDNTHTSME